MAGSTRLTITQNIMDPMAQNHLLPIIELYKHFKVHGSIVLRHCVKDVAQLSVYRASFDLNDASGSTLLNVTLVVELDRARLRSAMDRVDPGGQLDVLDDKEKIEGFMEAKAFELIRYLRAYNGVADDYEAMANLIHSVRGAIHSKKYGV